ncbi:MAG: lipopolysaccharide biosynthesis protein [Chthoniobacterales bacterium]
MSGEFPTDAAEPEIGFLSHFQALAQLARKHFHAGRGGRAKLAISVSLLSRVATTAASFVILPITVRYLGNEGYGLMITISAVVGWLQFANLGIGLGLQNALIEETARGNARAQKELVSTAVFSLLGTGLILLLIGLSIFPQIAWTRIFPPTSARFTAEIPWTVLVVFLGFISTIVLGFISPIYAARQELHISSIQAMVTSLATLLGTFIAVRLRWGLLGIVVCTIGVTAVMQWFYALWTLYLRALPDLRPEWSSITRSAAVRIYKNGLNFLVLQICNIAFFQIDAFLIATFLTIDRVTPYSVAQKVFLQTAGLFAIVTGSLWAAYGNAKAQGDFAWIRRTHGKMMRAFLLFFGALSLFMVLVGHWLLALWVGPMAAPGTLLIAGVALYFCAREWTALHAMLLNGLDVIRPQVWNLALTAALTLGLDLVLVTRLGPLGLAVGGFLAFAISGAWYLPHLVKTTLRGESANRPRDLEASHP